MLKNSLRRHPDAGAVAGHLSDVGVPQTEVAGVDAGEDLADELCSGGDGGSIDALPSHSTFTPWGTSKCGNSSPMILAIVIAVIGSSWSGTAG